MILVSASREDPNGNEETSTRRYWAGVEVAGSGPQHNLRNGVVRGWALELPRILSRREAYIMGELCGRAGEPVDRYDRHTYLQVTVREYDLPDDPYIAFPLCRLSQGRLVPRELASPRDSTFPVNFGNTVYERHHSTLRPL